MNIISVDWRTLFLPTESLLEMFLRGTIVYLFLILLLRSVQKRHSGALSAADFLFIVLLASSAHYALTGGQHSITYGLGVILTLVWWNVIINWLSFRYLKIKRFLHPPPLPLIEDGELKKGNMRKEFITAEELLTELRKQGIGRIANVKEAHIETDGEISFILYRRDDRRRRRSAGRDSPHA